jgi:asparagine synthase (glutamine-hydrolysing)
MCGITGSFERGPRQFNIDKSMLENARRGPDSQRVEALVHRGVNVQFGHTRLAIIDPEARADQPMWSASHDTLIVFNGEIYNFRDLRLELQLAGRTFYTESDTEVILQGYEHFGAPIFEKLIGMFAICLFDRKAGIAFLARDRLGVKPLYFSFNSASFTFSSNLRGILRGRRDPVQVDDNALNHYLIYGYTAEDRSIVQGVQKLSPGHVAKFTMDDWGLSFRRYHSLSSESDSFELHSDGASEQLRRCVVKAVERRLVSDVPVGAFLSGGYDSSLVVAIAAKELGTKLPCFTIGFDDRAFDESRYAAEVASYLNLDHYVQICKPSDAHEIILDMPGIYDEPFGDSSAIPTILLSRFTKRHVKVALGADGGDELFGGYRKYFNTIKLVNFHRMHPIVSRLAFNGFADLLQRLLPRKLVNADVTAEVYRKALGIVRLGVTPAMASDIIERSVFEYSSLELLGRKVKSTSDLELRVDAADIYRRDDFKAMRSLDLRYYLPSDIMVKVDRASMSCGLEAREPLLDIDLVNLCQAISVKDLYNASTGKFVLKEFCHRYLPKSLMDRRKMGFGIPVREWMRRELRQLFDLEFFGTSPLESEFDIERLRELVNNYYNGDDANFTYLWYVFNYSRWRRSV